MLLCTVKGMRIITANYIVLICLLILSVISDYKVLKIPNIYVFPATLFGLIINAYMFGLQGLKSSLFGIAVPIVLLGALFYARQIGAGDIKLFSAIGSLFGGEFILYAMAYSIIFAGILSLFCLIRNGKKARGSISTLFKSIKSMLYDFFIDIKMCCLTSTKSFNNGSTKRIIRLSPAIAMGTCLQVLISL